VVVKVRRGLRSAHEVMGVERVARRDVRNDILKD